jgi:hypothetical protein
VAVAREGFGGLGLAGLGAVGCAGGLEILDEGGGLGGEDVPATIGDRGGRQQVTRETDRNCPGADIAGGIVHANAPGWNQGDAREGNAQTL